MAKNKEYYAHSEDTETTRNFFYSALDEGWISDVPPTQWITYMGNKIKVYAVDQNLINHIKKSAKKLKQEKIYITIYEKVADDYIKKQETKSSGRKLANKLVKKAKMLKKQMGDQKFEEAP